ncbi:MAG: sphingomyelin phosphodiesterase [Pseudomonadota bacterium]
MTLRQSLLLLAALLPVHAFASGGEPVEPEPPQVDNPPTEVRSDLTVMSYNILQLPGVAGDWDDAQRLGRLPDAIRNLEEQPDVLVIQEAMTDDAQDALQGLDDIYPFITPVVGLDCSGEGWDAVSGNCSNSPAVVRGGVLILSRWPIEEKRQHIYQNSQMWTADYYSNKGFAYVQIDKGGFDYHIVGTHMQADSGDFAVSQQTRMAQLDEMRQWIDGRSIPSTDPVILTGDFNVEHSRGDHLADMLQRSNAQLSFPDPSIGSYSALDNLMTQANAYYYEYSQSYNDTLDYVITRNDYLLPAEAADMQVVRLKADDSWYWDYMENINASGMHSELSDHYPVVATFSYQ